MDTKQANIMIDIADITAAEFLYECNVESRYIGGGINWVLDELSKHTNRDFKLSDLASVAGVYQPTLSQLRSNGRKSGVKIVHQICYGVYQKYEIKLDPTKIWAQND